MAVNRTAIVAPYSHAGPGAQVKERVGQNAEPGQQPEAEVGNSIDQEPVRRTRVDTSASSSTTARHGRLLGGRHDHRRQPAHAASLISGFRRAGRIVLRARRTPSRCSRALVRCVGPQYIDDIADPQQRLDQTETLPGDRERRSA